MNAKTLKEKRRQSYERFKLSLSKNIKLQKELKMFEKAQLEDIDL